MMLLQHHSLFINCCKHTFINDLSVCLLSNACYCIVLLVSANPLTDKTVPDVTYTFVEWDNIRVMVIVWRLRGNIIRTALCWIV